MTIFSLISCIRKYSDMFPDKTAVIKDDDSITYRNLYNKSVMFASGLKKIGVREQDRVAIIMDNSIEFIVSVYGILAANAVFVPVQYDCAVDRMMYFLNDCKPSIVITNTAIYEKLMENLRELDIKVILVDSADENTKVMPWNSVLKAGASEEYTESFDPEKTAYIVYTSGSTGMPKGVKIKNKSLLNFIESTIEEFDFDNDTIYLSVLSFCFDGAFGGLFCPIAIGGILVIYRRKLITPKKLVSCIVKNNVTFFGCTPELFVVLIDELLREKPDRIPLKILSMGGDFIPKKYIKISFDVFPDIRLFNRYGPTEATSVVGSYEIMKNDTGNTLPIPIGHAVKNNEFYIYDSENDTFAKNGLGELYITGVQLFEGYWNDKELTKNSVVEWNGKELYRSGDYVCTDDNGNLIMLGRNGSMIKRYGYRVFISEIEINILKTDMVKACACVETDDKKVVAFVTKKESEFSELALRSQMLENVPKYIIPDKFIVVPELIYTNHGKIDKNCMINKYYR